MSAILRIPFASLLLLGTANGTALAADFPVKAPKSYQPQFDWSGIYIGAHTGYGTGHANATLFDPAATFARNNYGGATGGVQAGYNAVLPSRLLLGVEADLSFPNYLETSNVAAHVTTPNTALVEQLDYAGTVRGRIGYAAPSWMIYATAGFAWAGERFLTTPFAGGEDKTLTMRTGWAAGAGLELAIAPQWSARLEYLYSDYSAANIGLGSGARVNSALDFQTLRIGLNRKIDVPGVSVASTAPRPDSGPGSWEIWGQSTYLGQGYPAFNTRYSGPNSLTPNAQYKATWSNSLYINARLWDGGEFYFNPELLQGFGLNNTVGLGGFSSGEAQKSNFPYPRFNPSRLYLRQTFGFGGEEETLEGGPNQLSGKADVSRLTLQAGKFAVLDVFDGNAYAKDPRKDFMNWAIWAPGAFDYSADKVGLTYGGTAELNQKNWAFRLGYFLMDSESNSNNFDMKVFSRGEYVAELEQRYMVFGQPGKLRTIGWINSAFSGSYRQTLDDPALNLDIAQTRKGRIKYGYVVNLEQAVTNDIGLFGRWSWNDGKTEIMAFTDIDASLSGGVSIKGTSWGRPDDVIGIGGAVNALSRDHRDFIAAGGLGVLIGDGRLNYREEKILETYYAIALNKQLTVTGDYQYVRNPAYNSDRGPVSIFSGRLRGEF
ncbi:MAG TPA: carbohydrate porin [Afipia sp.]